MRRGPLRFPYAGRADRYGVLAFRGGIDATERIGGFHVRERSAYVDRPAGAETWRDWVSCGAGSVTRYIAEAAWFALAAALFLAWLMSGLHSDSVSGRLPACVSFGRAGALCSDSTPADRSPALSARDSSCASLGKGGRVCFARPAAAGP